MENNLFFDGDDSCGPDNPMDGMEDMPVVGMAYVPMQRLRTMYEPEDGFERGTIFPELDKPWLPKGCVK